MKVDQTIVEVVIFMQNSRVEGQLHLPSGGRLTDYLALAERKFLPVTDARIFGLPDNELRYNVPFLSINKDFILYIFLKGQIKD